MGVIVNIKTIIFFLSTFMLETIAVLGADSWLNISMIESPDKYQYHANFIIEIDNNAQVPCELRLFAGIPFDLTFKFNDSAKLYKLCHKNDQYAQDLGGTRIPSFNDITPGGYKIFYVDILGDYVIQADDHELSQERNKKLALFRDFAHEKPGVLTLNIDKTVFRPMPDYKSLFSIPWDGQKFDISKYLNTKAKWFDNPLVKTAQKCGAL